MLLHDMMPFAVFTVNLYGRGIDMKAELVDFETGPETTVDWDPRH